MTDPSDLDLWRRAEHGDGESFGLLFDRHNRAVYNFCFRRTANWALAEDLTSTVFMEAWRRRADIHPDRESLLPWLLGVATNVVRNSTRSQRRRDAAEPRAATSGVIADHAEGVASQLDDERAMARIVTALDTLEPIDRDVLTLWAWGELSYGEIADVLGVPIGTVRSRLSRARLRLRELTETGGQEGDVDAEPDEEPTPLRRSTR